MIIRPETEVDVDAIHAVVTRAFGQRAEADLVKALRDAGDAVLSVVAVDQGDVVGHLLLSRLITPKQSLALAPVSVLPDRQRQGVGSALIQFALEDSRHSGWAAVFVLGDPSYYRRFGFSVEAAASFDTEYPAEYFLAVVMRPDDLERNTNQVTYPPSFSDLA